MHDLVVHLDLAHCLQKLDLPLFIHSVVHEELRGDALEEGDRMVVVTFILSAEVDAVDQAHASFLGELDVDEVAEDLQRVGLREFLKDECGLLLVLIEHLSHESAAHDAHQWLRLVVLLK